MSDPIVSREMRRVPRGCVVKSPEEVDLMRAAGKIVAGVLSMVGDLVRPGLTTGEIDRRSAEYVASHGGHCSFKGYHGFPAHVCTSVNEEVVHGIPGKRVLKEGDILGLDVGVEFEGYHGDAAVTLPVGEISPEAALLLDVTRDALRQGLTRACAGRHLSDVSHAIQQRVEAEGFSVVRDLVGHGIGRVMHEDPQIPNFGPPGRGPVLKAGMTLAIEPMVNAGRADVVTEGDGWTVVTRDGSLSAHFEHTVLITSDRVEVLTSIDDPE